MQALIESIKYNNGTLPRDELQQIIERKEEAIPYLLQVMNEVRGDYRKLTDGDPTRMDFTYAYYLLAQFRMKELFPILIDILSFPVHISEAIFGDGLAEEMDIILAAVFDGDMELLKGLIENTDANEYARGQALRSLVVLVYNGQLTREFVMGYLKELLTDKLTDSSYYFNAEIVCCCKHLYPEEVYAEIRQLYERDLLEQSVISMSSIERTLEASKDEVIQREQNDRRYQFITDVIEEFQKWACFQPRRESSGSAFKSLLGGTQKPIVKEAQVGRNDPCPCGSGKKYKKCCGK